MLHYRMVGFVCRYTLFQAAQKIARNIIMFLPRNVDIVQVEELSWLCSPPLDFEVRLILPFVPTFGCIFHEILTAIIPVRYPDIQAFVRVKRTMCNTDSKELLRILEMQHGDQDHHRG
jgi:hypothetical protein